MTDLQKDTFWDGPANALHASTLDGSKYHDPATEIMPLSQRSVAATLPPGVWGATGTIIRQSGDQGAPLGHDPDAVARRINVDPDIPGQSFVYDPTQIQKDAMAQVMAESGSMQATSVEDRRFKAANALRRFAVSDRADAMPMTSRREAPREAPVDLPGTYVVPKATEGGGQEPMQDPAQFQAAPPSQGLEVGRPSTPIRGQAAPPAYQSVDEAQQSNGREVRAAAMGQPPGELQFQQPGVAPSQVHPTQPVPQQQPAVPVPAVPDSLFSPAQPHMHVPAVAPPATPVDVGPPTIKVAFEVRGMPFKQEAYFHQVVRKGPNLVLVYDKRAVGYPKMFPQSTDQDLAVYIDGGDGIYMTATTGIQFDLDNYELAVLLIKDEKPLPQ